MKNNSLQHKPTDYHDFVGIIILLLVNSTISFIEENNAGNAAAALMARLAPKAKVLLHPLHWISFQLSIPNSSAYPRVNDI